MWQRSYIFMDRLIRVWLSLSMVIEAVHCEQRISVIRGWRVISNMWHLCCRLVGEG